MHRSVSQPGWFHPTKATANANGQLQRLFHSHLISKTESVQYYYRTHLKNTPTPWSQWMVMAWHGYCMEWNGWSDRFTQSTNASGMRGNTHVCTSEWVCVYVCAKFTFRRIVNYHVITDNLQWFCFFNFQHFSLGVLFDNPSPPPRSVLHIISGAIFWCTTRSVYDKCR